MELTFRGYSVSHVLVHARHALFQLQTVHYVQVGFTFRTPHAYQAVRQVSNPTLTDFVFLVVTSVMVGWHLIRILLRLMAKQTFLWILIPVLIYWATCMTFSKFKRRLKDEDWFSNLYKVIAYYLLAQLAHHPIL